MKGWVSGYSSSATSSWFPVTGIMFKECRPVPFPYISVFVWLWIGSFSHCPLSGGSGFVFMWGGREACRHVRPALPISVSIFLSVSVILRVQLVLSLDLWPFLPQLPKQEREEGGGDRKKEGETDTERDRKRDRKKAGIKSETECETEVT